MALFKTTRPEWGSNPPDEPPTCADCAHCIDVGFGYTDWALCVAEYEQTADYDRLRAVEFGDAACDEWMEA